MTLLYKDANENEEYHWYHCISNISICVGLSVKVVKVSF